MSESSAEAQLIKEACRGNEAAFLVLYERHRGCVFRFAYRMLGSAEQAEDVTHDCFLALLRKPDHFDPTRASLRTYLCAAARNLAHNQLRHSGRETSVDEVPDGPESGAQPGLLEHLMAEEVAGKVQRAIALLPVLQREAVVLFEYEELSLAEIATVAHTDVGTIKSRLHRARSALRRILAPRVEHARQQIA